MLLPIHNYYIRLLDVEISIYILMLFYFIVCLCLVWYALLACVSKGTTYMHTIPEVTRRWYWSPWD